MRLCSQVPVLSCPAEEAEHDKAADGAMPARTDSWATQTTQNLRTKSVADRMKAIMQVCLVVFVCVRLCEWLRMCLCVCVCACGCVCARVFVRAYVRACLRMRSYVCVLPSFISISFFLAILPAFLP